MECKDFALQLDDYLDGQLDAARGRSIQGHMQCCANCWRLHRHAVVVQSALNALSAPAPHPGLADQALSRALSRATRAAGSGRRGGIGFALAATVVLGLAVSVFFAVQPAMAPVQTVTLTLQRPETVRVVFNSAKPLNAARLSIRLPENVELVGYGDRRELSWQTDLLEGGNLLQLPLIARGPAKEDLVALLSQGGGSKTFRLKIDVRNAGDVGM